MKRTSNSELVEIGNMAKSLERIKIVKSGRACKRALLHAIQMAGFSDDIVSGIRQVLRLP